MQLFDIGSQWMTWMEFAMVVLLLSISALQPHAVWDGMRTLAAPIQRRYTDGGGNGLVYVLQMAFQLGTIGLAMVVAFSATTALPQPISMVQYLYITLLILITGVGKSLLDRFLLFVFRYPVHEPTFFRHRSIIWQIISVALLVFVLTTPWWSETIQWIVPLSIGIIYLIMMFVKLVMLFGISIAHFCYIVLYILHAEVLPIAIIVTGTQYIITH